MSVARFIADQRTFYRVPVAVCCAILGLSVGWFYKWVKVPVTDQLRRRRELDAKVAELFDASGATYGSPRIFKDLVEAGWSVSVNTVADSMRRQGLAGRKPKRRKGLTKQGETAPKFGDLLKRDFTAPAPNVKWCGDITEIPTDEGKLYLATVLDLFSRRLLACPTSEHPNAELACDAIKIAAAVRGGRQVINGVVFHTDRGLNLRPTPPAISPSCARRNSVSGSLWDGLVRVSTTPPRSRSSPPSNTRRCPRTTSPPRPRHGPSCSPGATASTTPGDGTAAPRCSLQLRLK